MGSKDKSVLITGCSSGIGKALAIEFHSKGLRVFAASRSVASIESLAEMGIEVIQLNPASPESIRLGRDEVSKRTGGRLDILVNNAGQWLEIPAIETDLDQIKSLFDVNVFGVMDMVKQFSPLLIAAKGTIVNHGSMSPSPVYKFLVHAKANLRSVGMIRTMPHPMTAAYNASKAAVSQYSNTLRLELEPMDVKVIELVTGRVNTGLIVVPTLDDTSCYKPLEPSLQKRAREAETMPKPDVFAKAVAQKILRMPPSLEIFEGSFATMAWIISTFGPKWAFDPVMKSMTGLGKFRKEISELASLSSKK